MKRLFTLFICMIFISNFVMAQEEKNDSVVFNFYFPKGFEMYSPPNDMNDYFRDSLEYFDFIRTEELKNELNQLVDNIKEGKKTCSSKNLLDSIEQYKLIFVQIYLDEHYYTRSFPGFSFSEIEKNKYQKNDYWLNDIKARNHSFCSIYKSENILIINFNEFNLGQSFDRNSGLTYYLRKE